ncbi:MAG TPA: hypothetical protein PL173_11150 [Saprospiraceae bacterium]|nr:hypothetical protein [Saprospiraceae bacterium]HNG13630.1 hypothetical protein [Saprospiraceae bacterium]
MTLRQERTRWHQRKPVYERKLRILLWLHAPCMLRTRFHSLIVAIVILLLPVILWWIYRSGTAPQTPCRTSASPTVTLESGR